ncbi:uncharacterized protein LOC110419587 [Herrania umbratica]|uniref:Uncharacterized protein LOC110419587 n=1 Tax=Herrania umbratica TaxID=108875 RepID=A0A6J1AMB8_9ROSI|nr:uncharacterized protein LOC110419587 [Herrania umbratica]
MNAMVLSKRKSPLAILNVSHGSLQRKNQRRRAEKLNARMRQLRAEMEKISEEQREIKEGQRLVKRKFEAIELECDQLRNETNLIIQQSANTQLRLALMFRILRAREDQDFNTAAQLTQALRELVAMQNQKMEGSMENLPGK